MTTPTPGSRRSRAGFTLVEIAVVLVILAILIAMAAFLTRGIVAAQKRSLTGSRLALADAALVQFVMQQKRLPCPADGTKPSSDPTAGAEGARNAGGCQGTMQDGVLPWRALGLSETDALDGWDHRLTYRVDPVLGADSGIDMSWCDPAGTEGGAPPRACNVSCTASTLVNCTPPSAFLGTRGLLVKNVAGVVLMNPNPPVSNPPTGAAYVVISHGETGGGGYLPTGNLGANPTGDGTEEMKNYASLPYVAAATYYVDDSISDAAAATHFDDIVSRPSILSVASKAGLAPRSH